MFKWVLLVFVCVAAGVAGSWRPGFASPGESAAYASPTAAYREGIAALRSGEADTAVRALEYAAANGVLDAQISLAELYAAGDGVPRDDAKSFSYYQRIANQFADVSPRHPVAAHISKAFVALAAYHRNGIPRIGLKPDTGRAVNLYRHAASYFGDVDAQYNLARMYLDGEGVNRNTRLAVNWLTNAARKQHAPSQALLGDLLWRGKDDTYHQPLKGLALLSLAKRNAQGSADAARIAKLYDRAIGEARPEQREQAELLAARWTVGSAGGAAAVTESLGETGQDAGVTQTSPASTTLVEATPAPANPGVRNVDAIDAAQPR